ncbi:uncharacterized protein ATC70_000351 [Mucor velutinosus]|uniref:Tc1-like transposase DDE domain-containing protein n=1 Tax=Mucor velutinosus TaxID=708070 RepID=A0AAN7DH97_9FUNG|nr:hypothetical protein ATC70_000351 [Mucor velutinosus]
MDQFIFEDGNGNLCNEQGESVAVISTEIDNEQYPLANITNFGEYTYLKPPEKPSKTSETDSVEEDDDEKVDSREIKRKRYRSYKPEDKDKFFFYVYEKQLSIRAACKMVNIPPSTGQNWYKKGVESLAKDENLPHKKESSKVGRPAKLREEHRMALISIVDEKPDSVLEEMMEQLNAQFVGLDIHQSALHTFLYEKCHFSLKRAHFHSVERNSPEKIEERYNWVKQWQETDMDFTSNCVFIDEAAFHINMKRNYAWSGKGKRTVVNVPKTRVKTTTIIGAISSFGIVNVKVKLPKVTAPSKKRKATCGPVQADKGETVTGHYFNFVASTLDVMDKYEQFKDHYLIMDNATIHKNKDIQLYIEGRGYRCVYLPPYSPELNPIEQFWSIVKSKLKRVALLEEETLSTRISDSCNKVMISDLQGFCRYSAARWADCLERKSI